MNDASSDGPGRIFLSYAREDAPAAETIWAALQARGFAVWLDRKEIAGGAPFDVRIEKGLRQSDVVVVLLSPASVAHASFVRREIEYSSRIGKPIVPLRLAEVQAPVTIANRHYIEWRGDESVDELVAALRDPTRAEDASPWWSRHRRAPLSDEPEPIGRNWLIDAIEHSFASGSQAIALVAPPGFGKTSFSELLERREIVASVHYCSRAEARSCRPDEWIATVVGDLARVASYEEKVRALDPPSGWADPAAEFERLIVDLVEPGAAPTVIAIDGLDEVLEFSDRALLGCLASVVQRLPRHLRLIMTSRPDPMVLPYLVHPKVDVIETESDDERNLADLEVFVESRAAELTSEERRTLIRESRGNFLYAALGLAGDATHERGLAATYYARLNARLNEKGSRHRVQDLLGVLRAARSPLPEDLLREALGCADSELRRSLNIIRPYLRRAPEGNLEIFHKSFSDWLGDDGHDLYCSSHDGVERLAGACRARFEQVGAEGLDAYSLEHLYHHLSDAGDSEGLRGALGSIDLLRRMLQELGAFPLSDALRYVATQASDEDLRSLTSHVETAVGTQGELAEIRPEGLGALVWNHLLSSGMPREELEAWIQMGSTLGDPLLRAPVQMRTTKRALIGHNLPVVGMAVSGDGRRVASWDTHGRVIVFDIESGRATGRFQAGAELANPKFAGAIFDSDSTRLVLIINEWFGKQPGRLEVYDASGSSLRTSRPIEPLAETLCPVPGTDEVALLHRDGSVELIELDGGLTLAVLEGPVEGSDYADAAIPSADRLFIAHGDRLWAWDLDLRELAWEGAIEGSARDLRTHPDGLLLVRTAEGRVFATSWLQPGAPRQLHLGPEYVQDVQISPDGSRVAALGRDGSITLTESESMEPVWHHTLDRSGNSGSVCFSQETGHLVAWSESPQAAAWAVPAMARVDDLVGHTQTLEDCRAVPQSNLVLTSSYDATLGLWDPSSRRSGAQQAQHGGVVKRCETTPDGRVVVAASWDHTASVTDVESGSEIRVLSGHDGWVTDIAISPKAGLVATASADGSVGLWDLETWEHQGRLREGESDVDAVEFSGDGRWLAAASREGALRLWDVRRRRPKRSLRMSGEADSLRRIRESDRVLVRGESGELIGVDMGSWARPWPFRGRRTVFAVRTGALMPFTASPGGRFVAAGAWLSETERAQADPGTEYPVALFDSTSGRQLAALHLPAQADGCVVTSRGDLIVGDAEGRIWFARPGDSQVRSVQAHERALVDFHLELSPSGLYVVSAAFDNFMRIWDVREAAMVGEVAGTGRFRSLHALGSRIFAGDDSGNVWILDVDLPGFALA